jgi:16S rRNA (guanine527-N7)-methyltransferase
MLDQSQTFLLTEGAGLLGLELSDADLARFSIYVEEVQRWSQTTDLVSQADPETVIRKHVLDSLAVASLLPSDGRLLDLGSGAGFPGVVLAIIRPSQEVVLLEARRKRVSFLKEVVRRTKTMNVKVCEGRAETLAAKESLRGSFRVVITRATWSLKDFLRLASSFVADGGIALAMKGPRAEKELIGLEASFLQAIGFCLRKIHKYTLPFGGEKRQAIIFAKECFM